MTSDGLTHQMRIDGAEAGGGSQHQRGFSLPTAIFVLVVLAGLGAVMATFFTVQQQSSALDVLGERAYQASRAGIEWGAFQVLPASQATFATACRSAGASQTISPLAGTLAEFTVNVECSATSHVDATDTVWVYSLTSSASGIQGASPGSPDYVERVMQTMIWK